MAAKSITNFSAKKIQVLHRFLGGCSYYCMEHPCQEVVEIVCLFPLYLLMHPIRVTEWDDPFQESKQAKTKCKQLFLLPSSDYGKFCSPFLEALYINKLLYLQINRTLLHTFQVHVYMVNLFILLQEAKAESIFMRGT